MKNIIQLKTKTGEEVYPANNSNAVKVVNENKNLTTKLSEIGSSITSIKGSMLDLLDDIGDANENASSALSVANRIENEGRFIVNGDMVNNPDEEDITADIISLNSEGNVSQLKFKNRDNERGHKGYVILREDIPLSQLMTLENTIYEVRYNFDLGELVEENITLSNKYTVSDNRYVIFYSDVLSVSSSEGVIKKDSDSFGVTTGFNTTTISASNYLANVDPININYNYITSKQFRLFTICSPEKVEGLNSLTTKILRGSKLEIPNNCTLKFNGGKFSNGILVGNNTNIEAGSSDYIFDNVSIQGSYVCPGYVDWFGAKVLSNTTTILGNSKKIQRALDSAFNVIKFNKGYYYIDETLYITHQIDLQLEGSDSKRIIPSRKKSGEGYYGDKPPIIGTIVWSDLDISILDILVGAQMWTVDENISFTIKGGCFDVSKVNSYTHSVLDFHTGLATYCFPHIKTTLYGPVRKEPPLNLGSGYGIRFSDQSTGAAFYDGIIECTIYGFDTAVKHEDNIYNSEGTYITGIVYDCAIRACVCAYDFGTAGNGGGKILGWIQTEHFCPTLNNGECLIKGSIGNMYINPFVWDIQTRSIKSNSVSLSDYDTYYSKFTDVTSTSGGNVTFNRYYPLYVCDISKQAVSIKTDLGPHLIHQHKNQIKGFAESSLKKYLDFLNTNTYNNGDLYKGYTGITENILYDYYSLDIPTSTLGIENITIEPKNVTILCENCTNLTETYKKAMFTRLGSYISGYTTDTKLTISINNIYLKTCLSKETPGGISKLFITYQKGYTSSTNPLADVPIFQDIKMYQFDREGHLVTPDGKALQITSGNPDNLEYYTSENLPQTETAYYNVKKTVDGLEQISSTEYPTYISLQMESCKAIHESGVIMTGDIYSGVNKIVLVFLDLSFTKTDNRGVSYFKLGIEGSTKSIAGDKAFKNAVNSCVTIPEQLNLPNISLGAYTNSSVLGPTNSGSNKILQILDNDNVGKFIDFYDDKGTTRTVGLRVYGSRIVSYDINDNTNSTATGNKYYPSERLDSVFDTSLVSTDEHVCTLNSGSLISAGFNLSNDPHFVNHNKLGNPTYRCLGTSLNNNNVFITPDGNPVGTKDFLNTVNTFENKPNIEELWVGYRFLCVDLKKPLFVSGESITVTPTTSDPSKYTYKCLKNNWKWREADGAIAGVNRNGLFSEKPSASDIYIGFQYFVTDTNTPIWFNGTTWVKYDGTEYSS